MATKEYSIYNKTRESSVGTGVTVINSAREPLTALRVMVEGLGSENETGLWLTHVTSFPMVPRLSPFDLVYLDKDHCVVDRFELLPATEMPRFKSPASTALILPFQTISAVHIDTGDEFSISEIQEFGDCEIQAEPAAKGTVEVAVQNGPPVETIETESTEQPDQAAKLMRGVAEPEQSNAVPVVPVPLSILEAPQSVVEQFPAAQARKDAGIARHLGKPEPKHEEGSHAFSRRGKRKKRRNRKAFQPIRKESPAGSGSSQVSQELQDGVRPASGIEPVAPEALSRHPAVHPEFEAPEMPESFQMPMGFPVDRANRPGLVEVAGALAEIQPLAESAPRSASTAQDTPDPDKGLITSVSADVPGLKIDSKASALVRAEKRSTPPICAPALPVDAARSALEDRFKKVQSSAPVDKSESAPEEKKPVVHRILSWLYPSIYKKDRRHSERRPPPGLVAYERTSEGPIKLDIGNISSSGVYLLTEHRWEPGARVLLTLQRSGPFEQFADRRVDLSADPVRCGNDGVGLSFLWPEGMDLRLWEAPAKNGIYEAEPDYIVREIRMARALAFVGRICPAAADRAKALFHLELSNVRVANAVEIALKAEYLLASEPEADKMLAHPDLIVRILEEGSWVDVEWIQQLWAGLLATSCTVEGPDESNRVYIHLLSLLAPIHARILSAACDKAVRVMAGHEASSSPSLVASSAEEMARLTGSTNLMKVHRSIAELSDLGLLEKTTRTTLHSVSPITRTKPTDLGLEMYARCNGQRGAA
jgi:PilZ domain